MRSRPLQIGVALLLLSAVGAARAAPDAPGQQAADACEAAVAETIRGMRGRAAAQDVQFIAARRVALPRTADETAVRGEGRYRGAAGQSRPFTYSCAFDTRSGTTSGIVFKEALAAAAAGPEKPWEPDLTRLSPEACETAVAAELTGRYPRASRINFQSDTRRLRPAPDARTSLDGLGQLERAPGMNPIRFTYRCEFEPRTGQLLAVQTGD
ncbi:hypothetical protein [Rivibacter subsaxonicus]|uniref:Uncharacterized protein n=1 Tax=Rivibacter subsaxonicus TaxID=457575 RepID=A0A4Q7VXQ8_9BURK|nr:hypothetical protein [Rivibacter subsaxonicus]RZU01199.1 hypothetical protein EV670_1915 [Rivibacter subsaxonicus]